MNYRVRQVRPSIWTKPLSYLFMLIFVYILMVEIYFQMLDVPQLERERGQCQDTINNPPRTGSDCFWRGLRPAPIKNKSTSMQH